MLSRLQQRYPRFGKFLAARFARGEYLGLHLTIGLALSATGLWLFVLITRHVLRQDALSRFDLTVLEGLHSRATPLGDAVFIAISHAGGARTMTVIAVIGAVLLARRREWFVLGVWAAAFAGGSLLDQLLKTAFHRPRPLYAAAHIHDATWSFPSGHAMGALVGFGMVAYMLILHGPNDRRIRAVIIALTTLLIFAIGLSRLYLGVHYFSDVAAGYAAGLLWLSACISSLEVARRRAVVRR